MAELLEKDSDTIGLHLINIYKSGELEEISTTEKYPVVRQEGKRKVKRVIKFYNLDAIISVGYRVNSKRGIQFRKWATQLLKDYLIKLFKVNLLLMNAINLKSRNKFHNFSAVGGWVYKKDIYFLILNILYSHTTS